MTRVDTWVQIQHTPKEFMSETRHAPVKYTDKLTWKSQKVPKQMFSSSERLGFSRRTIQTWLLVFL